MKQSDDFSYEQIVKSNIDDLSGTVKIHGEAIEGIQKIVDRIIKIQEKAVKLDDLRESQIKNVDDKVHAHTNNITLLWLAVFLLTVPHVYNAIKWIMEVMT